MIKFIENIFGNANYIITQVPTYPSGTIGFFIASKSGKVPKSPVREIEKELADQLKFYSKHMHEKAFVLPPFAERRIYGGN